MIVFNWFAVGLIPILALIVLQMWLVLSQPRWQGMNQAGPGIAYHLVSTGRQVALVEADKVGGTCLNRGCRGKESRCKTHCKLRAQSWSD